jgi:hypothetical protein
MFLKEKAVEPEFVHHVLFGNGESRVKAGKMLETKVGKLNNLMSRRRNVRGKRFMCSAR